MFGQGCNQRKGITTNKEIQKAVIKGTRIAVAFVVDLLGRGWTTEQIYDHLTADDVQACLAYASDVLKSERVYVTTN